jgi:hypothetical protein
LTGFKGVKAIDDKRVRLLSGERPGALSSFIDCKESSKQGAIDPQDQRKRINGRGSTAEARSVDARRIRVLRDLHTLMRNELGSTLIDKIPGFTEKT